MKNKSKKELSLIIIFSIFTTSLVFMLSLYSLYQVQQMHNVAQNIYEHPLKVSNAALNVKLNVIRIHRDMKDVVLFKSEKELFSLVEKVNKAERIVYENLLIIHNNILGDKGLILQENTKELFKNWKLIRDEVIDLVKRKQLSTAIDITKGKGANHVLALEKSASDLYNYAHIKAEGFKLESYNIARGFETVSILLMLLFLTVFGLFSRYIFKRIKKYIEQVDENEQKYITEKNNLNNIFTAMEDGVYVVNENFDIEYVNAILTKDFGSYEGRKCYEYFHGSSEVCEWCKNSEILEGKTVRWEWSSSKNGKTYDLIDTPLYNLDGTISKLELFRDITLNNEMKTQLEFKKKYLQAVFDVIPQIMITTDGTEIDRVNLAMLQFFEYESVEVFRNEHECICDYFIEENDYISREVNGIHWLTYILQNQNKLHRVCMKKGEEKCYFVVNAHKLELDGKERSVVTFSDVSEVENLRARLEIAVNGTKDGLWDWNLETGELYFSPQWKKQLGYADDELENTIETWVSHVHPDDKEKTISDYTLNMEGESDFYENIHRLRHKDGSWVWILDRGQSQFDVNGKAIRMVGFHTDITQQKELEIQLKTSQEQFAQFMEFIPANIIIKENDVVIYSNSKTDNFFQLDTIVGKTVENLFPKEVVKSLIDFETKAYQHGFYEEVLEILNAEGEVIIYRNMAFVISDKRKKRLGIVSIDITTEHNANKEIARVLSAFERSSISVVITDLDGTINYVNPSWCQATGYSKEELIGQNPRIVKSGSISAQNYKKMWDELTSGNIWTSELKNRAKDGTEFWEDSTIMPSFDVKGVVDGYIAFKLDITDKINLRQELKNKEELMIAQSRHAAMGEMISMIAHQWRQPISVIAMEANNILADIELDTLDKEELHETSKDIISQTQELSKTIDDFREFFKPNKDIENILIIDVINDALNVIGKSLENNDVHLSVKVDETVVVKTFSRELMQVFINIIKNAKETFMDQELENKNILVTLDTLADSIVLTICDNAGGIDTDIINEIFEPYFTTKRERNGTGLGLYMSKTIIEKHLQGTLTVENSKNGACFKIVIPMKIQGEGVFE